VLARSEGHPAADVTPLSLGVETLGGVMTHRFRAYTIPTRKVETYSTASGQPPASRFTSCKASASSRRTPLAGNI